MSDLEVGATTTTNLSGDCHSVDCGCGCKKKKFDRDLDVGRYGIYIPTYCILHTYATFSNSRRLRAAEAPVASRLRRSFQVRR